MIDLNIYNEYILTDFICAYYQYLNGFILHMLFYIVSFSHLQ